MKRTITINSRKYETDKTLVTYQELLDMDKLNRSKDYEMKIEYKGEEIVLYRNEFATIVDGMVVSAILRGDNHGEC